jgi:anaerobic carbon-monoxide dehydrogenase iron sulfur subunit
MKKQIYVAVEKCLGCRSCELACAVAHSRSHDLFQAVTEEPAVRARLDVQATDGYAVPLHCRHCEDAPCVRVCPTHAMSRLGPEDPIVCRDERCIGCTLCVLVCPFGVLRLNASGKAILKCDLCADRLQAGLEPACVTACPTRAIRFVAAEEYSREIAARARVDVVAAMTERLHGNRSGGS